MKEKVQSFGRFLSAMVMPNIGAFIAWGLMAAFFIPDGWIPNEALNSVQSIMCNYLLPVLIAYTGGKLVDDVRGGVCGAIAVMGAIAAFDSPQFLGAMILGPLSGWLLKLFDRAMKDHIKAGFEMIINNFSVGILGMIMAILAYYVLGPIISGITAALATAVGFLQSHKLLPLMALIVEPAKVLFLNNAIGNGVLVPLGIEQAAETGKSLLFLVESNPGPGLGILLAYCVAGKGSAKETAPGAIIIQFLGGIHEIYFPYVLMNPILIIAAICGGAVGIATNMIFNSGLVAVASPGSIIAILAMTAKGSYLGVILSVVLAAAVSFAISVPLLKAFGKDEDIEKAQADMQNMKAGAKGEPVLVADTDPSAIKYVVFACDAGMGSSAMGASVLEKKLKEVGRGDIEVTHASVSDIPSNAQIVVTHQDLKERAAHSAPQAQLVLITNFMNAPQYDEVAAQLSGNGPKAEAPAEEKAAPATDADQAAANAEILIKENIHTNQKPAPKEDVIRAAGQMLVDTGYVDQDYVEGMIKREDSFPTNLQNGIAIPHGVEEVKAKVKKSGLSVQTFPESITWNEGEPKVKMVIGIAGKGDEHLDILARIATKLQDPEEVDKVMNMSDDEIIELLTVD